MTRDTEHAVAAAARHVATVLMPEQSVIAEGLWAYIAAALPDLAQRAPLKLAHAGCHAASGALLEALARGASLEEMTPKTEVILVTRAMVQNGFNQDEVMRGYRVGITYWCERWAQGVELHCPDPSLSVRVVSHGTTFVLGWLELISGQLIAEYRDEAERLAREGSLARAAYVRRALLDDDFDVTAARRDLGYDVTARHVALVLTRHEDDQNEAPLDSIARILASALTTATPLVVRVDLDTTLCWIPTQKARAVPAPQARVLVGQGRPASGLEGFRRSYRQASEAARIARLAGLPAGTVTRFDDIELAALCSGDSTACRAFITEKLGTLAADTDEAHRLRTTLETFFAANSNFRATAARLGVHHNTVRYRLERASTLLGRAPEEHRLQLELALHLAARLGVSAEQDRHDGEQARKPLTAASTGARVTKSQNETSRDR